MSAKNRFLIKSHCNHLAQLISEAENNGIQGYIKTRLTLKVLTIKKSAEKFFAKYPGQNVFIPEAQFKYIEDFLQKSPILTHQEFLEIFRKFNHGKIGRIRREIDPKHHLAEAVRNLKANQIPYTCCQKLYKECRSFSAHIQIRHPEAFLSTSSGTTKSNGPLDSMKDHVSIEIEVEVDPENEFAIHIKTEDDD